DVDKKKCRWLELKFTMVADGRNETFHGKFLIPEEHLKAGASPLDHVVKGWASQRGGEAKPWKQADEDAKSLFLALVGGPVKDGKKLPKTQVDGKLGKLDCEGVWGLRLIERRDGKVRVSYETRLHDKAPFGVVTARIQFIVLSLDGEVEEVLIGNFLLAEVGKGARSELPDLK